MTRRAGGCAGAARARHHGTLPLLLCACLTGWLTPASGHAQGASQAPGTRPAPPEAKATTKARPAQQAIAQAIADRKAGRFKEAFAVLNALLETDARNARAHHELGVLYALHGQFAEATNHLRVATTLAPTSVASRRNLAEVLRADGQHAVALAEYARIVDDLDARPAALRGLALCHEALGKPAEAEQALQTLAKDYADTREGGWAIQHLQWLKAQQDSGEVTPAVAEREGIVLFGEGRYEAAADWLAFALRAGPSADRAYRYGMALLAGRDYLGAVAALQLALTLDQGHAAARSAWPTAVAKLRVAGEGGLTIDLAPEDGEPPTRRAARALREGDLLLAMQIASTALKGPHKGLVLELQYAEALLRDGRLGPAEAALKRVLKARPDHPTARAALAEIAWRRASFSQARKLANLPAPVAGPLGPEATSREARDLARFVRWRRAAFDHTMGMLLDPGLRPRPAYQPDDGLDAESVRKPPPTGNP